MAYGNGYKQKCMKHEQTFLSICCMFVVGYLGLWATSVGSVFLAGILCGWEHMGFSVAPLVGGYNIYLVNLYPTFLPVRAPKATYKI